MRKLPGLIWETFEERGEEWVTLLVEPRHCMFRGAPALGLTIFRSRQVRINVAGAIDEIPHTRVHERLHAAFGNGRHEKFVRAVEGSLWTMMRAGGATLPPYPRGFWAMRERALDAQGGEA